MTNTNTELLSNNPTELRTPPLWLQYFLKSDPKKPDKKPGKAPCVKYGTPDLRAANLKSLDHLLGRAPQAGFQRWVGKDEGFVFVTSTMFGMRPQVKSNQKHRQSSTFLTPTPKCPPPGRALTLSAGGPCQRTSISTRTQWRYTVATSRTN